MSALTPLHTVRARQATQRVHLSVQSNQARCCRTATQGAASMCVHPQANSRHSYHVRTNCIYPVRRCCPADVHRHANLSTCQLVNTQEYWPAQSVTLTRLPSRGMFDTHECATGVQGPGRHTGCIGRYLQAAQKKKRGKGPALHHQLRWGRPQSTTVPQAQSSLPHTKWPQQQ